MKREYNTRLEIIIVNNILVIAQGNRIIYRAQLEK